MADDTDRFAVLRQPIEQLLLELLQTNNLTDVCRAWLQAGQSLAMQGGSEDIAGHGRLDGSGCPSVAT